MNQTATDLLNRRTQLHEELTRNPAAFVTGRVDPQWFRDRVDEMAWINRELSRIGVIPPVQS